MKNTFKSVKYLLLAAGIISTASILPAYTAQAETASSAFTVEQTAELDKMFRKFMTDNPETIMESVRLYQEQQEKRAQQTAQEKLADYQDEFAKKDAPMGGNPDGDVTLVEFFDYNCGYCKKAFSDIQKLIGEDSNLRVVFQEMPILSPTSTKMAALSLAAKKQGKYFEMHTALMDHRGNQSDATFLKLGEDLGLDTEQLKKDADSAEIKSEIDKAKKMAFELGIRGTPGFVIGDKIYPGYIGIDGLRKAIKEIRTQNAK